MFKYIDVLGASLLGTINFKSIHFRKNLFQNHPFQKKSIIEALILGKVNFRSIDFRKSQLQKHQFQEQTILKAYILGKINFRTIHFRKSQLYIEASILGKVNYRSIDFGKSQFQKHRFQEKSILQQKHLFLGVYFFTGGMDFTKRENRYHTVATKRDGWCNQLRAL